MLGLDEAAKGAAGGQLVVRPATPRGKDAALGVDEKYGPRREGADVKPDERLIDYGLPGGVRSALP